MKNQIKIIKNCMAGLFALVILLPAVTQSQNTGPITKAEILKSTDEIFLLIDWLFKISNESLVLQDKLIYCEKKLGGEAKFTQLFLENMGQEKLLHLISLGVVAQLEFTNFLKSKTQTKTVEKQNPPGQVPATTTETIATIDVSPKEALEFLEGFYTKNKPTYMKELDYLADVLIKTCN